VNLSRLFLGLLATLVMADQAAGQESAVVEQLAPVLAAEDARDWQASLFQKALVAPDSLVRQVAALAAGRIGDQRATPLLLPLLDQPDSTVKVAAAFALGLLRDSAAVEPLIQHLTGLSALDTATADEVVTALAKIGGKRAADFCGGVLQGEITLSQSDPEPARTQMLLEAWRFGRDAPAQALLPYADDTLQPVRWRAIYSLARLRAPIAATQLLAALRADDADTRSAAARALTRAYADSAKLPAGSLTSVLIRAVDDDDPRVRVEAMRSLASYHDSTISRVVAPRLGDPDPNVRVQAAITLGELGGGTARSALQKVAASKENYAVRREALVGLAHVDSTAFSRAAAPWRSSADWRERAAAAEGWARAKTKSAAWFISDSDGRVIAAGLQAWSDAVEGPDRALIQAARAVLPHPDAGARSVAATILARAADPNDLGALIQMYGRTSRDSFPDASLSALAAIAAIGGRGAAERSRVDREFLEKVPRPTDYLIRAWAEANWPEASNRWGPAYPIATGRTIQDYRELARQYLLAPDSIARPHVFIETEQQGVMEVELLGPDAPLTVANFLRLVDRRFFDGNRWHRVVPDFVVQDGDPRGDGFGGPGGVIRDEINRNRYGIKPELGMALSGPDTGSSQWFINLSPQPHLDGVYTVFGRVVGNSGNLARITQGNVIRTIRR
jgi:cyclophilin family peptidyl-prolyl cis-trans isomerase/HEAT repeat protein